MTNLIEFLASLGRDSSVSTVDYAAAVAALDIGDAQREALLARDAGKLGALVTGQTRMSMILFLDADGSGERESRDHAGDGRMAADAAQLH